jgi:agmatinase
MDMQPASRNMPERMDLPFVGLATFGGQPACTDWDKLDGADVAVLGVPIDTASSYRVGTRFGPRAIREMSMFHGFGPEGVFDFEDEVTYLSADEVRIVDAGDSDVIYADTKRSLANAELAVRALLDASTMPYILGGDHAITMATVAAYSNEKPIHIVHLDAHFDFIDGRNGITWGHGSPMRRASEMAHVRGITTLGPHNMAAVSKKDYEAAKAYALAEASRDRREGRARPHRGWRTRLRINRHRQLRPVDRAGYRNNQPWRLLLLRGQGLVA